MVRDLVCQLSSVDEYNGSYERLLKKGFIGNETERIEIRSGATQTRNNGCDVGAIVA